MSELSPEVCTSVDGMAKLCAEFHRSLRRHGVPWWAAALWTMKFLELNITISAALDSRGGGDMMTYPAFKR